MIYATYHLLTRLVFALTFPVFLVYSRLTGKHRVGLRQRLGFYNGDNFPGAGATVVWLHGASVGEVILARPLAVKIKTEFPDITLVLSTTTEQGLKVAQAQLGSMAKCIIAPLDLPGAVARAVEAIRPDIYVCLETELWPNLLMKLRTANTRLFLLNGRLSERSCRRYGLMGNLAREILTGFDAIAAITAVDARRFIDLGADPGQTRVTGNAKYDLPAPASPDATRLNWRQRLGLDEKQPVLIAGSTHNGEEKMLLEVFASLKNTLADLVLIIAPRHLTRFQGIRSFLASVHADYDLLSAVKRGGRRENIIIVDTIGELAELYSAADFIFCGGSLVPRGGHNIMEAAIWGVPVFYGPSMIDFSDATQLLDGRGGIMVKTHWDLAEKIKEHFQKPDLYKKVAKAARLTALSQQGATARQLKPVFDAIRSICSNGVAHD